MTISSLVKPSDLSWAYETRPGALINENANAVVAPGPEPSNLGTPVDINAFHAAHVHAKEVVLVRNTKKKCIIVINVCLLKHVHIL